MTFADKILEFNQSLSLKAILPPEIDVMNPFKNKTVFDLCKKFYHKYYNDKNKRFLILGINPGRFGAGLTGIPFTDPIKLEKCCGIKNSFDKKPELSAEFIYEMISAFGGADKFYARFYINSVCPLGFISKGVNLNYYDNKQLQKAITPFAIRSIKKQIAFGIDTSVCFCLGEGKNFSFLTQLNEQEKFFEEIVPLSHPRFIMQYKRKQKEKYIALYLEKFEKIKSPPK
jgi:hypothetical protein